MNAENPPVQWKRVTLIGVGLLGGSLGLALRQRGLARSIMGYVRREASISECVKAGAVDAATLDLEAAVQHSDLVVFCTPIGQMSALCRQIVPWLKRGVVVTDVGSVKHPVVRQLEPICAKAGAYFIGSHPMAGSEKMGVAAAKPDLFENAVCVVTPSSKSHLAAVKKVEGLWRAVGARLLRASPQQHDEWVSRSSHLPHVVAAVLANTVLGPDSPRAQASLCANGFRDTTRIASGSPEMWRDIAIANRVNLVRALKGYVRDLVKLQALLQKADDRAIGEFFSRAKRQRDQWLDGAIGSSPE